MLQTAQYEKPQWYFVDPSPPSLCNGQAVVALWSLPLPIRISFFECTPEPPVAHGLPHMIAMLLPVL